MRTQGGIWFGVLLGVLLAALGAGCGRVDGAKDDGLFVLDVSAEPAVLLLLHGEGGDRRYFFRLKELVPRERRTGFGVGVGLDDTMVRVRALRNEPDPGHPGNYLVQLECDCNDALFESPLVSWNPQREQMLFRGEKWSVKLVNRFERRRLK